MNAPLTTSQTARDITRRRAIGSLAAGAAALAVPGAHAQAFPNKPLRMIVGFAPGGAADVMARVIAKGLGTQLGQQIVVDNKPGAEGIIASQELIRSAPDGYTLMMGTKGAKVVNARYKGDVQAMTDLVSGQIHMMFSTGTLTPTFVKDGKIKSLVTLLPKRSPLLPDVPTAAELGIGKLTITPWAGFFGPAGMPGDVVDRLSLELRNALARPDVRDQLVGQGFSSYGMTAPEFTAFFKKQYDGFVSTVRENNVKFE